MESAESKLGGRGGARPLALPCPGSWLAGWLAGRQGWEGWSIGQVAGSRS